MPFAIVRNDITKMQVDAIVNSANPRAIVGGVWIAPSIRRRERNS